MYDPFLYILLIGGFAVLVFGYYNQAPALKYTLLLASATLFISFGMIANGGEGFREESGINFHVVRDAGGQIQDLNGLYAYRNVTPSNSTGLIPLADIAQWGGVLLAILTGTDWALNTYRNYRRRNNYVG